MRKQSYQQYVQQQYRRSQLCAKYGVSMKVLRGQTYSKEWEDHKAQQRKFAGFKP